MDVVPDGDRRPTAAAAWPATTAAWCSSATRCRASGRARRITEDAEPYWHAEAVESSSASPDRIESLCPIAGVDGAGCCDLAFAEARGRARLKGDVVANQLERLGGYQWKWRGRGGRIRGRDAWRAHTGAHWVPPGIERAGRFSPLPQRRARHRPAVRAAAAGMLDGLDGSWPPGAELHVVLDDEGQRHVVQSGPAAARGHAQAGRRGLPRSGAAGGRPRAGACR